MRTCSRWYEIRCAALPGGSGWQARLPPGSPRRAFPSGTARPTDHRPRGGREVSLDPGLRNQSSWTEAAKRALIARGYELTSRELARHETFILVTSHFDYGKKAADRIPELQAIAEWLAAWAGHEYGSDHNVIALGDFNIDRKDDPLYQAFTSTGLTPAPPLQRLPRTIMNQQIRELEASRASTSYDVVCECVDDHCFEVVTMKAAEFDAVTATPGRYVVARGHEHAGAEEVVERHERYLVVSRPLPAKEAAAASSGGQRDSDQAGIGS